MTSTIQAMFDAMSNAARHTRSVYHLTLGKAIDGLSAYADDKPVRFDIGGSPGRAISYRGYYSDLALTPNGALDTVGALLHELRDALGQTFEGYKGGDFLMEADTPLWFAAYGAPSGCRAIIGIETDEGGVVLLTKDVSE